MDYTQTQKDKHTETQVCFQMKPVKKSCYILNYHQTSFTNAFWYQQLLKLRPSGSMNAISNVGCAVKSWEKKNMGRVIVRWVDVALCP